MTEDPALWAPMPGTPLCSVAAAAPGEAALPAYATAAGLPAPGQIHFAPGALRGIQVMHTAEPGPGETNVVGDAAVQVLGRCLDRSLSRQDLTALYEAAVAAQPDAGAVVFRAAQAWAVIVGPGAEAALTQVGTWLLNTPAVGAARTGIVLLMVLDDLGGQERAISLLGRFPELAFEACAALGTDLPRFEPHLLDLARRHRGWGRVHAVLQLTGSRSPAVRRWLVEEGFRNQVTPGYTALPVAIRADLASQVATELDGGRTPGPASVPLLDGARDLLLALLDRYGPSGDMSDYPAAGIAVESWLVACKRRGVAALDAADLDLMVQLLEALDDDNLLASHEGISEPTRFRIGDLCRTLLSSPAAREVAAAALEGSSRSWAAAVRVGPVVGLDVLPALRARLRQDPDDVGTWWELASGADDRPAAVVELAMELLPEDGVPSSVRAALPGQGPHAGLTFVLQQVVSRHPGMGWPLIERTLRSPLPGARAQALNALLSWPRPSWPDAAMPTLRAVAAEENDDRLRTRFEDALQTPDPQAPPDAPAPAPVTVAAWDEVPLDFRLSGGAPSGWYAKETVTYLAPDGQANLIASSEPLDPSIGTTQYATTQGDLLRKEFPGYQEFSFEPATVFGGREGFLRHFSWSPPDGVQVEQIQAYHAHGGRGWTMTATAPATAFERHRVALRRIMAGMTVRPEEPAEPGHADEEALRAAWASTGWKIEPLSETSLCARSGDGPGDRGIVVTARVQPGLSSVVTVSSANWTRPRERLHELLLAADDWNTRSGWPAACLRSSHDAGMVELVLHHGLPLTSGVTVGQLAEVARSVVTAAVAFSRSFANRTR